MAIYYQTIENNKIKKNKKYIRNLNSQMMELYLDDIKEVTLAYDSYWGFLNFSKDYNYDIICLSDDLSETSIQNNLKLLKNFNLQNFKMISIENLNNIIALNELFNLTNDSTFQSEYSLNHQYLKFITNIESNVFLQPMNFTTTITPNIIQTSNFKDIIKKIINQHLDILTFLNNNDMFSKFNKFIKFLKINNMFMTNKFQKTSYIKMKKFLSILDLDKLYSDTYSYKTSENYNIIKNMYKKATIRLNYDDIIISSESNNVVVRIFGSKLIMNTEKLFIIEKILDQLGHYEKYISECEKMKLIYN